MNNKRDLIGIKSLVNLNNDDSLIDTYNFLDEDDEHDKNNSQNGEVNTNNIIDNFIHTTDNIENLNNISNMPKHTSSNHVNVNNNPFNKFNKYKHGTINEHNEYNENNINEHNEEEINKTKLMSSGIKNYSYTHEEKKPNVTFTQQSNDDIVKSYINSTLDDGTNDNTISKTYEEEIDDEKILLMDKIDEIKKILVKKQINIDNVPIINYESNLQEIKYTYKLLQVKNNRDLNINFTNNIVKIGTSLLEKMCDGKKSYFGIKPNLVGYTKVVQYQLKDLNIEAEQISGEIFNRQSTSPMLKIAAAIIPGMFYYATSRSGTVPSENYQQKNNIDEAMSEIQNI